jgi:hypothetical protein
MENGLKCEWGMTDIFLMNSLAAEELEQEKMAP